jgi:tripartite-type tricarboxylate transporter receptor subunit TctC
MLNSLFFIASALVASAIVPVTGMARAQDYPNRPIRIVTTDTGNVNDFFARAIAQGLAARMGQQVIVENRGGANGLNVINRVSTAQPDGYTLMIIGTNVWLYPVLNDKAPWDPFRDFSPLSIIGKNSAMIVVPASLPVKTVKELIALAKAKPGTLNYAATDDGAPSHLAAELFNSMAGVDIVRITYKGGGQALTGVVAGESHVMVSGIQAALPLVKAGRLTALGVTAPTVMAPNLPLVADTLPGYQWITHTIMMTAPQTPAALVNRLNAQVVGVLTSAEVRDKFLAAGTEPASSTPAELTAMMKSEMAKMSKVIKAANIRHSR